MNQNPRPSPLAGSEVGQPGEQYAGLADELEQLAALLHRLEQSDSLTLDELDAVILQADMAYKNRLARLARTKEIIEGLGQSGGAA